jgi:hypothetical protein
MPTSIAIPPVCSHHFLASVVSEIQLHWRNRYTALVNRMKIRASRVILGIARCANPVNLVTAWVVLHNNRLRVMAIT